jgi:hypothetical protein
MNRTTTAVLLAAGLLALQPAGAQDQPTIAEEVMDGCASELASFCSQVTPGEGRILACIYAHQDKLSGRCEYALYDAAVRLERAINALTYVATECRADIETVCADVQAGEGRIAQCLDDNRADLSAQCTQALSDVGLE